jgi:hypothetical protein
MISKLKENIILSELTKQNFDKEYELIIDNFLPSTSRMSLPCGNEK